MRYLIQPKNEGQDLNYSEIKEFNSLSEIKKYTKRMTFLLNLALPQGLISVKYEKY